MVSGNGVAYCVQCNIFDDIILSSTVSRAVKKHESMRTTEKQKGKNIALQDQPP
jgi:hypothetical protein